MRDNNYVCGDNSCYNYATHFIISTINYNQ